MDTPHVHTAEHRVWLGVHTESRAIEICECGASRYVVKGVPDPKWHSCSVCTHPWGLNPDDTQEDRP